MIVRVATVIRQAMCHRYLQRITHSRFALLDARGIFVFVLQNASEEFGKFCSKMSDLLKPLQQQNHFIHLSLPSSKSRTQFISGKLNPIKADGMS